MKIQKYKIGDVVRVNFDNTLYDLILPERLEKCVLKGEILGVEILNSIERYFINVEIEEENLGIAISRIMPFLVDDILGVVTEGNPRRRSICKDCPMNLYYGSCDDKDKEFCFLNTDEYSEQLYIGDTVKFLGKEYVILGEYKCPDVNILDKISAIREREVDANSIIRTRYRNSIFENTFEYRAMMEFGNNINYLVREKKYITNDLKFNSRKFYSYVSRSDILLIKPIDQEPWRKNTDICKICILEECKPLCRWKALKTL